MNNIKNGKGYISIDKSIEKLINWIDNYGVSGWDPYDWAISPLSKNLPYFMNWFFSQVNVYSPINLRPLFKIKKGINPKGLGLLVQGYLRYYELSSKESALRQGLSILNVLDSLKISKNGYVWWTNYFDFVRKYHKVTKNTPDFGGLSQGLKAYAYAYYLTKNKYFMDICHSIVKTFQKMFLSKYKNYLYVRYYPSDSHKIVFDISGSFLSSVSYYLKYVIFDYELFSISKKISKFLISFQKSNGVWPFSYFFLENKYHYQIDYHQGFIIEGLADFYSLIDEKDLKLEIYKAILKGTSYYIKNQFDSRGRSYYRYPWKYPIDVHNQAQGIITFAKLYKLFNKKEFLDFAIKIANWTITNMQSPEGYFYTHKWPFIINKIPYLRWGQAWMLLSLTSLLNSRGDLNE